jgi:hypothetical protein
VIAELAQKRFRIAASVPPKALQPVVFRWVAWVAQAPVEGAQAAVVLSVGSGITQRIV